MEQLPGKCGTRACRALAGGGWAVGAVFRTVQLGANTLCAVRGGRHQGGFPLSGLKGQVFLGDEQFVQRMQSCMRAGVRDDVQIPAAQRRPPPASLPEIERGAENRNAAIIAAYATGAYFLPANCRLLRDSFHDSREYRQAGQMIGIVYRPAPSSPSSRQCRPGWRRVAGFRCFPVQPARS